MIIIMIIIISINVKRINISSRIVIIETIIEYMHLNLLFLFFLHFLLLILTHRSLLKTWYNVCIYTCTYAPLVRVYRFSLGRSPFHNTWWQNIHVQWSGRVHYAQHFLQRSIIWTTSKNNTCSETGRHDHQCYRI